MSPTTEARLLAAIRQGNSTAYTALVTGHLGMVYDLAQRLSHHDHGDLLEELSAEGRMVLCEEAPAFAAAGLQCRFSTYVHTRIWRAMVSWRRTQDAVPGTEWQARVAQKTRLHREALAQRLGYAPSEDELTYVYGAAPPAVSYCDVDSAALAVEPAAPEPEASPWAGLRRDYRELLDELLEQQETTGNASLAQVARRYHVSRGEVLKAVTQLRLGTA